MDLDTTRGKNNLENLIYDFERGKIDILVGTQMVTKGLDFDHVGLVGVIYADQALHYPDFRSAERTFQTLVQVSGRAGRKHEQGNVMIQTFQPEHPVFWMSSIVTIHLFIKGKLKSARFSVSSIRPSDCHFN